MGTLPTRKEIPPWVKVPEDLKDPEVLQVHTVMLRSLFGPHGSRIPHMEQVSRAMFELKTLESSELTDILVYGAYDNKVRAKWILQSMAERYHLRQERDLHKLEEAVKTLELDQCWECEFLQRWWIA